MKIGIVIPTRNNRSALLGQCHRYMMRQVKSPEIILDVDFIQTRKPYDLTDRYKYGFEQLKNDVDYIACIEDDDYYAPNYLETIEKMITENPGKDIYGIGVTWYYHIQSGGMLRIEHEGRASAFCTVVSSAVVDKIDWNIMHPLWFDISIWKQFKDDGFAPVIEKPVAIGIKHGIGLCGGGGHTKWLYEHRKDATFDKNYEWLRKQIGDDDLQWYKDLIILQEKKS